MQFTSLLLLVLGATTLATPIDILDAPSADINSTSSTTEQHLEKRGTYGWIASFADGDSSCKAGYAEPRPQIKKDCINFSPVDGGSNIGINWGTFPYAFDSLNFYSHANCLNKVAVIPAPKKHQRANAQTCWSSSGKQIRSVRTSDTAGDAPN